MLTIRSTKTVTLVRLAALVAAILPVTGRSTSAQDTLQHAASHGCDDEQAYERDHDHQATLLTANWPRDRAAR